jgi:hypothetical protein
LFTGIVIEVLDAANPASAALVPFITQLPAASTVMVAVLAEVLATEQIDVDAESTAKLYAPLPSPPVAVISAVTVVFCTMVTAFLSEDRAKAEGALAATLMWITSTALPTELVALIPKTYKPLVVGFPLRVAVAGSKLRPGGSPRVS